MAKTPAKQIFRITFWNQNQIYEVYVSHIYQSDLYGFIEVEEYQFGERSQMILNPAEEKLKTEFSGVKRSFIPLHAVVRIDEMDKQPSKEQSLGKITEIKGERSAPIPFPTPFAGAKPTKPGSDS